MASKRGPGNTPLPTKMSLLSKEDKAALSKSAAASLTDEMKQQARDEFFEKELARLRREQVPADQIVPVTINAAPYVPNIMLDGVQYFHGYTYEVALKTAIVLYEQMQRSWNHQDEIDGRKRFDPYRRPQNMRIGAGDIGTATQGANGVVVAEV